MELDDCILIEDKDCFIVNPAENIKSNKELAEVKNKQGSTFYSNGQFLNARNAYSEAIALDPDCAIYYANRAAANMSLNETATVVNDLDKAISLDPGYLKAYTRKFNYLISIGDLSMAKQVIAQIESVDKDNSEVAKLTDRIRNIKYNENCYEKAISKNEHREALFYMDNLLNLCPLSINLKLKKAESLAYLLRHEDVISIVDGILRKDTTNSDGYFIRGLSYFYQDNLEKAIAHFQQALRWEPEHKKSHLFFKRAKLIKQLKEQGKDAVTKGDLNKAIEHYKEALAVDSSNKLGNAKLYFNLSVVYGKQKKTKEALVEINQAIKLDESYDKAYMKRASLYDDLEMYEESVRDYEFLYKKLKTKETKDSLERAKLLLTRSKRKNYYKILGISKQADTTEIKRAYKKRALEHHPDRHANVNEEERLSQEKKFKDVNEAYNCLVDPAKRQRYDNGYDDVNQTSTSFNPEAFRMFCDEDILNNIFFNFKR